MIKALRKNTSILFYYENDVKKIGASPGLYGNCSGLYGDCSNLYGDCSRLSGNLDDCNLTVEERTTGVDINNLIKEEAEK